MASLFRASHRKGQWDRALGYSQLVARRSAWRCLAAVAVLAQLVCLLLLLLLPGPLAKRRGAERLRDNLRPLQSHPGARHLLSSTSSTQSVYYNYKCENVSESTKGTIVWETCDVEKSTNTLAGWIVLYVFVTIVTFIAMAIVCDDFFVPSLEVISEKLHLSEDVAGATFMAAGSSAPELFSSLAAVSFDSDAGVGTIAGSAVFNLLVIVSLSAAFAGQVLHLDWRPLARDSVWYLISILYFIYAMHDSIVQVWDAVVLLVLYALYIVIMVLNSRLMDRLAEAEKKCNCSKVEPGDEEAGSQEANENGASTGTQSTNATPSPEHRELKQFKHNRRNSVLVALHDSKGNLREDASKV